MTSTTAAADSRHALIVLARGQRCALPLVYVLETMRPLPLAPSPGAPPYVLGVSIIRGLPLPVVDLGALLGGEVSCSESAERRFVTVRVGARQAAIAVESVIGVRTLDSQSMHALPPLLRGAPSASVTALSALDRELVAVLDGGRLLPDDVWTEATANVG